MSNSNPLRTTRDDTLPMKAQARGLHGRPGELEEESAIHTLASDAATDDTMLVAATDGASALPAEITDAAAEPATGAAEAAVSAAGTDAAVGAESAGAASGSALAGVSPWAIGGGLLGVAVVAAAAGDGSSSGGGSSKSTDPIATDSDKQPTDDAAKPDTDPVDGGSGDSGGSDGDGGTDDAGHTGGDPTPTDPTRQSVTVSGANAHLDAGLFDDSVADTQYIRITSIQTAESADPSARLIRYFRDGETDKMAAYEVIESDTGMSWEEAKNAAAALGGRLLTIESDEEREWLTTNLSSKLGETPQSLHDLSHGSWIGLVQTNDAAAPDAGWHWYESSHQFKPQDWDNLGLSVDGIKMPNDLGDSAGTAENNAANHGAIIQSWKADAADPTQGGFDKTMLYDYDGKLHSFVIEYNDYQHPLQLHDGQGNRIALQEGHVLSADNFDKLSWNTQFGNGGKISYIAVDGTGQDAQVVEGAETVTITITEIANAAAIDTAPPPVSIDPADEVSRLIDGDLPMPG
ncbi:MAG: hypothetical protein Q4A16_02220 [Lautropia sp.]|nr:hypothetical protein [Lautropia sp.]